MTKTIFTITGIRGCAKGPPERIGITVRRKGKTYCGACGGEIKVGEQYFMLHYPVCLGCAEYE